MLSRKRARIAIVLLWIGIPISFLGAFTKNLWLLWLGMAVLVAAVATPNHLCPHCGKFLETGRWENIIHWSKPDEGYCRHCGSLLKYDDQPK